MFFKYISLFSVFLFLITSYTNCARDLDKNIETSTSSPSITLNNSTNITFGILDTEFKLDIDEFNELELMIEWEPNIDENGIEYDINILTEWYDNNGNRIYDFTVGQKSNILKFSSILYSDTGSYTVVLKDLNSGHIETRSFIITVIKNVCDAWEYNNFGVCTNLYNIVGRTDICGGSGECFDCYQSKTNTRAGFVANCHLIPGGCNGLAMAKHCHNTFGDY